MNWQGWQDLNLRMQESKSCALPLGDTPKNLRHFCDEFTYPFCRFDKICRHSLIGWGGRIRTYAMLESESNALPLGDTPSHLKLWGDRRGSNP